MKSIVEYTGQELRWVHPNRKSPEYELRSGDEVLIRLSSHGMFMSQVRVDTEASTWIIERKGLLQTISVHSEEVQAPTEVPNIERRMSGQVTLRFPDGHSYTWRCSSFWRNVWTWFDAEGAPLLQAAGKSSVRLESSAGRTEVGHLALLVGLSWFLHRVQEEGAAAASAIVPVIGS